MSNLEYVAVDVFNGEGYSEPTVKKINADDWLPFVCEKLSEYPDKSNFIGEGTDKISFSYNSGDDGAALSLHEKPADKVMLVMLNPDFCGACSTLYDTFDDAYKQLHDIVTDKKNNFDSDDVAEFLDEDLAAFSGHSDDGFFHGVIIQ